MEELIYTCDNALSTEVCNDIIQKYEDNIDLGHDGCTLGGVNKHIKDTTDLNIPMQNTNMLFELNNVLYESLISNVKLYCKKLEENHGTKIIKNQKLYDLGYMIQKYNKNQGKYVYHNDFAHYKDIKKRRIITYLWYLNDVEEGGVTEFWKRKTIKPEAGKLLLFPASWTFPHCGQMPISHDKYIITGWLCEDE